MSNNGKIALVTGASKGIGRCIAKALRDEGFSVYGTSRNPNTILEKDKLDGIIYLRLDLSDEKSIKDIVQKLPDVDVLINNAGSSQMGAVEEVSIDKIRELFQIDFFGHVMLIKYLLPSMRKRRSGIIINITSLAGFIPVPYTSVYAACKSAMNTISKGLRNEVCKYGIKIVALAPSFIDTKIYQEKICSEDSDYYKDLNNVREIRDKNISLGSDPTDISKAVIRIIRKKNPAPTYVAGKLAHLLLFVNWILPEKLNERIKRRRFNISN